MKFRLEKCANTTFLRGRLEKSTSIELDNSKKIKELKQEEVYKYLGVNERSGIVHVIMKKKIKKESYRRVRAILKTKPNSNRIEIQANRIQAINTLAITVVTYSLNIIN